MLDKKKQALHVQCVHMAATAAIETGAFVAHHIQLGSSSIKCLVTLSKLFRATLSSLLFTTTQA